MHFYYTKRHSLRFIHISRITKQGKIYPLYSLLLFFLSYTHCIFYIKKKNIFCYNSSFFYHFYFQRDIQTHMNTKNKFKIYTKQQELHQPTTTTNKYNNITTREERKFKYNIVVNSEGTRHDSEKINLELKKLHDFKRISSCIF